MKGRGATRGVPKRIQNARYSKRSVCRQVRRCIGGGEADWVREVGEMIEWDVGARGWGDVSVGEEEKKG